MQRILVLSPHPDDGEIGCGGTIKRFMDEGSLVLHVLFSAAEKINGHSVEKEIRFDEFRKACEMLGVERMVYDFPHRVLSETRQAILEAMVDIRESFRPSLVLLPTPNDFHQDHRTISEEGIRAFKACSLWGYEMLWNNISFSANIFVKISKDDLKVKMNALACYRTQSFKAYMHPDFTRAHARTRGVQGGMDHAEAFEHIRGVI